MTSHISTACNGASTSIEVTDLQLYAASGDPASFGRVVRRHVDLVYSLCRRELHGDASLADDATQAVFILLSQKAAKLRDAPSLVGWFYDAARNCSRNARRASLRRERHEMEAAKRRQEIMLPDASSPVEQAEVEQAVHQAIARLDDAQRDILLMRFFQRMTLGEVGQAVGISEDAARQRLNRAIRSLRAIMERGAGLAVGAVAIPAWLESHAVIPAPQAVTHAAMNIGIEGTGSSVHAMMAKAIRSSILPVSAKWAAVACIALVGLIAAVATSQPTSSPATAPPPASQPAEPMSITVRALIDGRDQLILKSSTACWRHFDFAAPGMHGGRNEATTINGVAWHPAWDDSDMDKEVRVEKSMSDKYDGIQPAIPAAPMTVTIEKTRCRGDAKVVQQPSVENDFTTIVEFDDNSAAGSDWYQVKATFTPQ